jgi:uncharacterized protein YcaQ
MSRAASKSHPVTKSHAKRIWLRAQRLDVSAPFGDGPEATRLAVAHLGYVQIDTINVIERCHHHILYSLVPRTSTHLRRAKHRQDGLRILDAYVVYVPTRDIGFFLGGMKHYWRAPSRWFNR